MRTNPTFKIIGFVALAATLVLVTAFVSKGHNNSKYAWINLNKVYNEFNLKKDLENKFKAAEGERQKILDSLGLRLKMLSEELRNSKDANRINDFQTGRQQYLTRKQQFEEDNDVLRADYNKQVLTQINQYVKEYAAQQDLSIVLGADGSGALMYAEESIEITDPVLLFINNRYKDIK